MFSEIDIAKLKSKLKDYSKDYKENFNKIEKYIKSEIEEILKLKWTQYMLELSSLKTYERVDSIARKRLGLFFPGNKDIHLVN